VLRSFAIAAALLLSSFFSATARSDSGADQSAHARAALSFLDGTEPHYYQEEWKWFSDFRSPGFFSPDDPKYWVQELELYNKAIAAAPNDPHGYLCRGRALLRRHELVSAIDDLSKVIALATTEDTVGYEWRAEALIAKGDFARAAADYDHVKAANGDGWLGYAGSGLTLIQLGRYDRAIEDLTRAVELASALPDQPQSRDACPSSSPMLAQAALDEPRDSVLGNLLAYRASARFYKGGYDQALIDIDRSMELIGYSPVGNTYRGLARLALGKCSMGFNDLKLAAFFARIPLEQLMTSARPFVASTSCAGIEP
jgi:tetratricopeptide (TPR) repeat protein